jgi:hypothetical protein
MFQWHAAPAMANTTGQVIVVGGKVVTLCSVRPTDGLSHNWRTIHWRQGNAGLTNGTVQVSLRDPSVATAAPGRDDGTPDQSVDQVNTAATTNYSSTLGADRALTPGDLVAIVHEVTARVAGTFSLAGINGQTSANYQGSPNVTHYDGTTHTPGNPIPCLTLEADDGTIGIPAGGLPRLVAINTHALNTGAAFSEIAIPFTVPKAMYAGEIGVLVSAPAGADFDLVLMRDTTDLKVIHIVTDTLAIEGSPRLVSRDFADVLLEAGQQYYAVVRPITATDVTVYSIETSHASHLQAFAGSAHLATRAGGAWTPNTARLLVGFIGITGDESSAGGGSRLGGPSPLLS